MRQFGAPPGPAEVEKRVDQCGHFVLPPRAAQPPVALHAAR